MSLQEMGLAERKEQLDENLLPLRDMIWITLSTTVLLPLASIDRNIACDIHIPERSCIGRMPNALEVLKASRLLA